MLTAIFPRVTIIRYLDVGPGPGIPLPRQLRENAVTKSSTLCNNVKYTPTTSLVLMFAFFIFSYFDIHLVRTLLADGQSAATLWTLELRILRCIQFGITKCDTVNIAPWATPLPSMGHRRHIFVSINICSKCSKWCRIS